MKASMLLIKVSLTQLGLLLCFAMPVSKAVAKSKNYSFASITTYHSSFSNISLSSESLKPELPQSLDVELALRFRSIFNLAFVAQRFLHDPESPINSLKAERQAFGLELKIDLPGVFFIGKAGDFSKQNGKNWPFNSFLYGNILRVNTTNESGARDSSFASRYGFGLDVFIFNQIAYISMYVGGFQFEANTFLQSGVGLGVTL